MLINDSGKCKHRLKYNNSSVESVRGNNKATDVKTLASYTAEL